MALNYAESHMLTLPEQITLVCECLDRLKVKSVVNKLLFLGNLYEVKSHNLDRSRAFSKAEGAAEPAHKHSLEMWGKL